MCASIFGKSPRRCERGDPKYLLAEMFMGIICYKVSAWIDYMMMCYVPNQEIMFK